MTKRAVALTVFSLILLVAAWFIKRPIPYLVVSILITLLISSLFWTFLSLGQARLTRTIDMSAIEDQELEVELTLQNGNLVPRHLIEVLDFFAPGVNPPLWKTALVGTMEAKKPIKWSYRAKCPKRGLYYIGPCDLISQDPFGLFRLRKRFDIYSKLMVWPKTFPITNFPALIKGTRPWFGLETARISPEVIEFYGIREYQRQDGLRRIHWPSTARLGTLTAKQYEKATVSDATIVLDLHRESDLGIGKESSLEYGIRIAASIAKFLLVERESLVQFIAKAKESLVIPFGKGISWQYRILEELAAVKADGAYKLGQVLNEMAHLIPEDSTLIVIALDTDREALETLAQFRWKWVTVILIVLVTSTFAWVPDTQTILRKRAESLAISKALEANIYYICQGEDLQKKFQEQPV